MPCATTPDPPKPTLPSPFSVEPPALPLPPLPAIGVNQCCLKPMPTEPPAPPAPLALGLVNPAFIAALNAAEETVATFIDQLSFSIPCPRE